MYTAIIVEPRKHPALHFVLDNFLNNLSDEWNIIIFHGNNNLNYINNIIDNNLTKYIHRISKINLNVDNLTLNEYNHLFKHNPFIYDNIPTETFLVFQTDTMIFPKYKDFINEFLHYDYVGAPIIDRISYNNSTNETELIPVQYVGNGGLSLRKKSKMLEIMFTEGHLEEKKHLPEDLFFSGPSIVNINKPSGIEAQRFSIETFLCEKTFGCHKSWAYMDNQRLFDTFPEIIPLYELNNQINIAIIYVENIPNYKQHFISMTNTGITKYNTHCFLVLGQEYNENIKDFIQNSIYTTTTVNVINFNDIPNEILYNETEIKKFYRKKSIELVKNSKTKYDIVIYTHTSNNVLTPNINYGNIANYILNNNPILVNNKQNIIISSLDNISKFMNNIGEMNATNISIDVEVVPINNEKYNTFYGFNGLKEICDSYNYSEFINNNTVYDFSKVRDYDTIYITNLNLKKIYKQIMKIIQKLFILVSGEGDCECPKEIFNGDEEFNEFINWKYLQHWFCQNCFITHPKITLIPLGLDYHTMMYYSHIRGDRGPKITPIEQEIQIFDILQNTKPFWERIPLCFGNFQHLITTKYGKDRVDAINMIPSKLIYYDSKLEKKHTLKNQTSFAFVVSPFGQDYECIRTWEALCLGCIVIIRKSLLDDLYKDLPVLIINDWSEINTELLNTTIMKFKEKHLNNEFKYEKLYKKYWAIKIEEMKQICKNQLIE